jgi:electron transport complex protein RnfD
MKGPQLLLTTSPFLKHPADTRFLMWQVNYALVPVVLAAVFFFGIGVLLIVVSATAGALVPEWAAGRASNRASKTQRSTLHDGSAVITGVLLALTLPPATPLWIAFVGGVAAISIGKLAFGGIGYSVLNPALVGRAFLQAAFPETMTRWTQTAAAEGVLRIEGALFAFPFTKAEVDGISEATPLASMKFDGVGTDMMELITGTTTGSLGETSFLLIILCGLYLGLRRVLNWRIPVSIFASVAGCSAMLSAIDPGSFAGPSFHLFAGGLALGAIFMATDPVTSPITQRGCWIFGIGIGILVVVIREFGGLPEGVMYSILLMNAVTPLINRVSQPRTYGHGRDE